jgi:hypothetical protein
MARTMNKAPSHAWRAVVVKRSANGTETTTYFGPYWRRCDAQTRITNQLREFGRSWSVWELVDAHVEAAPLGAWERA